MVQSLQNLRERSEGEFDTEILNNPLFALTRMNSLRIDRLLTLYFFKYYLRNRRPSSSSRVPVLLYHSISNADERGVHPYYRLNTSPEIFSQHMKWLHDHGYKALDLDEAAQFLSSCSEGCEKRVVITFDDGYRNFYTNAYPVLKQYDLTATVFLPTAFIGHASRKFKEKDCLTWSQVKELQREGIVFGSHTVNHPQLVNMRRREVEIELRASREMIEDRLGGRVFSFSFPYAFPEENREFVELLRTLLIECCYRNGVSTRIGLATGEDDFFFMKRLPVSSCDDLEFFDAQLSGAYDWIYTSQRFLKQFRRAIVR